MKMLRVTGAVAAACGAMLFGAAFAQDYVAVQRASVELYSACLATDDPDATDSVCACVAGFFGGALSDREFQVIGRLAKIGSLIEGGAAESIVQAEIATFFAEGFTQDEVNAVSAKMETLTPRGDVICAPFAPRASS